MGDKELGGQDFDREILNLIDKKYKKLKGKGIDVNDRSYFEIAEKLKNFQPKIKCLKLMKNQKVLQKLIYLEKNLKIQ